MAYHMGRDHDGERKDGVFYLFSSASSKSLVRVLDDKDAMTDKKAHAYIKKVDPELYARLFIRSKAQPDFGLRQEMGDSQSKVQQPASTKVQLVFPEQSKSSTTTSSQDKLVPQQEANKGKNPRRISRELQAQLQLDGVSRQTVLSAANRLYPDIEAPENAPDTFRDKNAEPDHPFNYPPNSEKALELRALRQLEINETLAEVHKYERALSAARSHLRDLELRDMSPDASVLITRPFYMEPRQDRYKKQGLTRYDQQKWNKNARESLLAVATGVTSPFYSPINEVDPDIRYCYCRECDDGGEMVRCSKEWCPIGWFHLRCTGLKRLPYVNEEFYCCYCADGIGYLIAQSMLEGDGHVRNDMAGSFADRVAKQYRDQKIQTEIVFEEQDDHLRASSTRLSMVYDDDEDDFALSCGKAPAGKQDGLHDKINKWKVVNSQYQKVTMNKALPASPEERRLVAKPATPTFDDDKCAEEQRNREQEEDECAVSEASTIRISDSPSTSGSETSINDKRPRWSRYGNGFEDAQGLQEEESDGSIIESIERDPYTTVGHTSVEGESPLRSFTIESANSDRVLRCAYYAQPSTITDTSKAFTSNSTLSSPRSGLPMNFSSSSNAMHVTDSPHTPILAPRIGKSKKPWGTPINIENYDREPASPSPAPLKRKSNMIEIYDEYGSPDSDNAHNVSKKSKLQLAKTEESDNEDEIMPLTLNN